MRRSNEPKRITRHQITGQQGVNFVEQIVLDMGFAWHPANASLDAGIDGTIEIIDPESGKATNYIIQVQVKATSSDKTDSGLVHYCKARDIDYWMNGNTPVILIKVFFHKRKAYWVDIKEYFADPKRRKQANIAFNEAEDRFDSSAALALMKLAVNKDIGPYMPATEHEETLYSNLIEVISFPSSIYCGSTNYTLEEIFNWEKKQKIGLPSGWVLTEKMIRSIHDLHEEPWIQLCDRGSIEQFGIDEWSDSDDPDVQREFVRIMNQVLRSDMKIRHIWHSKEEQCFFFPARWTEDNKPIAWNYRYRGLQKWTSREVVSSHRNPHTKEIINFRHSAMRSVFLRFGRKWYIAITPHYIYTTDGKTPHPYSEELLSGIKRLEYQSAVLGQTIMWQYKLTHIPGKTFFESGAKDKPMLIFGNFLILKSERGLDDESWFRDDILIGEDSNSWGLF